MKKVFLLMAMFMMVILTGCEDLTEKIDTTTDEIETQKPKTEQQSTTPGNNGEIDDDEEEEPTVQH